MSKKRKNGELPETMESLKSRNEELEAQNMTLMARIQQFEQEIRKLKENCKCPKDIAGNFRIVPLLAMRKIFEFLSFDDLKELRCVSSWFFTTVSNEFESLFGTYHIKLEQTLVSVSDTGMKFILEVPKEIDAIIRPGVKLAYNLDMWDDLGAPDADLIQEILKYKNNITEINVALCHDNYDFLLEEDFYFKNLERINIDVKNCKSEDCRHGHLNLVRGSCNNFISRYANQLQQLAICDMDEWQNDRNEINGNDLAYLPNLKSLLLKNFGDTDALFVIESVNIENVTKLEMRGICPNDNNFKDLNIRNLSVLSLDDVDKELSILLLNLNSSTLTKLQIGFSMSDDYEMDYVEFEYIQFSKLKYLNINGMFETDALTFIQSSKNTIAEIHLSELSFLQDHNNLEYVTFLQLPHLKKVHLEIEFDYILSSKLVFSLINACDENTIILTNNEVINKSMLEELRQKFREN